MFTSDFRIYFGLSGSISASPRILGVRKSQIFQFYISRQYTFINKRYHMYQIDKDKLWRNFSLLIIGCVKWNLSALRILMIDARAA